LNARTGICRDCAIASVSSAETSPASRVSKATRQTRIWSLCWLIAFHDPHDRADIERGLAEDDWSRLRSQPGGGANELQDAVNDYTSACVVVFLETAIRRTSTTMIREG